MVTHDNLVCNSALITEASGLRAGETIAGWLPLFHDMDSSLCTAGSLFGGALRIHGAGAVSDAALLWLQICPIIARAAALLPTSPMTCASRRSAPHTRRNWI